jgi:RecJ-like exonuclease
MENKLLLFLLLSIAGIFFLLILPNLLPEKIIKIEDIKNKNLNQEITLEGKLKTIYEKPGFQILKIEDKTGSIEGITFSNIQLKINQTKTYKITGVLEEYNHTLQVNINKIEEN